MEAYASQMHLPFYQNPERTKINPGGYDNAIRRRDADATRRNARYCVSTHTTQSAHRCAQSIINAFNGEIVIEKNFMIIGDVF